MARLLEVWQSMGLQTHALFVLAILCGWTFGFCILVSMRNDPDKRYADYGLGEWLWSTKFRRAQLAEIWRIFAFDSKFASTPMLRLVGWVARITLIASIAALLMILAKLTEPK